MVTVLILIAALCILGWGFYRSRSYGRLGLLSWFQSLAVSLPWLLFFGLSLVGITLNLAAILLLLLGSTGTYIWLGREMRTLAKRQEESDRAAVLSDIAQTGDFRAEHSMVQNSDKVDSSSSPRSTSESPADDAESYGEKRSSTPEFAKRAMLGNPMSPDLGTPEQSMSFTPMPEEDIQKVQAIFSIDTFFSTDRSPYYNGVIFKGNLRGEAEAVYHRLAERLAELTGKTYRLFLMADPSVTPPKPIVVVLPRANDPSPSTQFQWFIAALLFVATGITCMVAASIFQGFSLLQDWSRWSDTLPLAIGIVLILLGHEAGHWAIARRYAIRLGPPFFLPTWQVGSFGSITRIESVLPHRNALFDIGFSGPAVGGALSFLIFFLGLVLSHEGSLFQLSPSFFQSSILVGTLARLVLGNQLQNTLVDINPLVIVGWLGLLITAINVMPVGQLDGGRIVQSIYGRKVLRRTSIVTLLVLAIATFFNPLALYWMIVILLLQRQLEQPQLNELTEPDDTRAALGLMALFLMAAMLLPLSPALAARLGIGG